MNANARWIAAFAFGLLILLPSAKLMHGQILVDPRGEGAATGQSAESSTSESTSSESTAPESAASLGREDARSESSRVGQRTLPAPQQPDEQSSAERVPPPRPSAALPAEPEREPTAQRPRGTGRPFLGITFDPTVRDAAVVGAIVPDSPAEKAGLQPADEIVAINDQPVASIEEAFAIVGRLRPGEILNIEFSRRITARTQAMLEDAPDDAVADTELDTLPQARTTSYREPSRGDYEEAIPADRQRQPDRIRILRRYGDDQTRPNLDDDEEPRDLDRRQLEEWLRDRQRPPERPRRSRPLLPWRRG